VGIIVQSLFLVLVGLASVMVCGGLLVLLSRLVPLLDRQRVTLSGCGVDVALPHRCSFCGQGTDIDPSDQHPPADYCDHGGSWQGGL